MATNIQSQVSTNVQSQVSTNQQQIMDMFLNNMIVSRFSDVMKEEFQFNLKNIGKIVLLMSTSEIKTLLTYVLTNSIDYLKKAPALLYLFATTLVKFNYKKSKQKEHNNKIITPLKQTETIKMNVDVIFLIAFYKFIKSYKNCTYTEELQSIDIKNIKEKIFINQISDVYIMMDQIAIKIKNQISYSINNFNREIIKVGTADIPNQKEISFFLDLLTTEQRKVIENIYNNALTTYKTDDAIILQIYRDVNSKASEQQFSVDTCVYLLLKKYPKLNQKKTFIEIVILVMITQYTTNVHANHIYQLLKTKNKFLFDSNNNYQFNDTFGGNIWNYQLNHIISSCQDKTNKQLFMPFLTKYNELLNNTTVSESLYLELELTNTLDIKFNMTTILDHFIDKVSEFSKKTTNKIKIFSLTLENEKKVTEKPNPEYENWSEKKQLLSKMDSKITDELKEFIILPVPPKTIITETITPKITTKQLNELEKNIETLYLREKDKSKLLMSLFQFRDKKDILQSLGIPNKLNILLYGEPGTGKSTTIQAVATYLQKDIYYVDLKDVKTNQELQILFEYVNKNANSSIVVCEDIDAMTDVVLKREDNIKELKPNELVKNQDSQISLEYLLNILQGTLTMDDSIFIVTTNHIKHLDPAFYRDGRFDVKIELKLCDHFQINKIYHKMIGRNIDLEVLDKIPENKYSPASIIFHVKNYIFNTDMKDEEILSPFIKQIEQNEKS